MAQNPKNYNSVPFLISTLKKAGFREEILINVYRSYALSNFIYSAPVLSSASSSAIDEMESFQRRCLRIINIDFADRIRGTNSEKVCKRACKVPTLRSTIHAGCRTRKPHKAKTHFGVI